MNGMWQTLHKFNTDLLEKLNWRSSEKHPLAGLIGQSGATVCTGIMNGTYGIGILLLVSRAAFNSSH